MSIQEIESLALRLPPSERAALAQHLIASLDDVDETQEAWAEESARRAEDLASGAAKPVSAEEVFADARRAIS